MNVAELIERLGRFPPETPVYTLATCECCTDFVEVDEEAIGERDVATHVRYYPEFGDDALSNRNANPRAKWEKPALVIAGDAWAYWPESKRREGDA